MPHVLNHINSTRSSFADPVWGFPWHYHWLNGHIRVSWGHQSQLGTVAEEAQQWSRLRPGSSTAIPAQHLTASIGSVVILSDPHLSSQVLICYSIRSCISTWRTAGCSHSLSVTGWGWWVADRGDGRQWSRVQSVLYQTVALLDWLLIGPD